MSRSLRTGADVNNQKITSLASPTSPTDAVNKQYVDNVAAGLSIKPSARVASTANVATLTGLLTVDGVTVAAGDRVLLKNQTTASANGIYVASAGAWALATDSVQGELLAGALVIIDEGTVNGDTMWILTTNNPITVGTTSLTFSQFQVGVTYTAGGGILISGGVLSTNIDGTTIIETAGVMSVSSSALATAGFARKQSFTLTSGATTATITHTLSTTDVHVQFYDISGATPVPVDLDYVVTSSTVITVTAASTITSGQYRAVVIA